MTLSEYLKTTGRKHKDLAENIGSDVSAISLWANGERHPATYFAVRIEAATGGAVPVTSWPLPDYARSSPHLMTPDKSVKRGRHKRAARGTPRDTGRNRARKGAAR